MSRPMWTVKAIKAGFPYSALGARMTKVPLLGRLVERMLFAGDDIIILPRERVVSIAKEVAAEEQVVLPSRVIEHFVEQAGHLWVMHKCICRDAMGCEHHPVGLGCLFMGDAVLGINPALGREVTRQEALDHLARCREAGLFHLVGRNRLDSVWMGVGPGDRLLTVCNCCTCCCIWRMLPHVNDRIGAAVTRMPGVSVRVVGDCSGCGTCAETCFAGAAHLVDGRAVIGDECRGCGRCVEACPQGAIELDVADSEYVARAIARIAPKVDVS